MADVTATIITIAIISCHSSRPVIPTYRLRLHRKRPKTRIRVSWQFAANSMITLSRYSVRFSLPIFPLISDRSSPVNRGIGSNFQSLPRLFGSWKSNLVARDRRLGERDCIAEKKEGRVSKQGREERNVISGEDGVGAAVSVDVNPAAHFPFDVAVPPPPPPRVDGVAAELVSVNCNAFWPIRDYTMK